MYVSKRIYIYIYIVTVCDNIVNHKLAAVAHLQYNK